MRRFFVALLLALAPAPAAFAANPVFDSVGIKVPGGANVVTIQGGTGGSTLIVRLPLTTGASGQPLLSGGAANPWQWGTVSGNTTEFVTGSGAFTSGHGAVFDASGNVIDGGAGLGSGTVTSVGLATPNSTLTMGGTNPVITSGTVNVDINLSNANTWAAAQSFGSGDLKLNGATSGATTLNAAAVAGANTITLPAGTTDFSATGGASQVVKQTASGGAFTVARLACADLSDSGTGCTGSGGGGGGAGVNGYIAFSAFRTGRFYAPPSLGGYSTGLIATNTLFACPFVSPNAATVTSESFNVASLSGASGVRMGIYTDSSGVPGTLVAGSDSGTVTPAAGFNSVSGLSVSLSAGTIYWRALVLATTGATQLEVLISSASSVAIGGAATLAASFSGASNTCVSNTQTFGAMPGTFPTGSLVLNVAGPAVVLGF